MTEPRPGYLPSPRATILALSGVLLDMLLMLGPVGASVGSGQLIAAPGATAGRSRPGASPWWRKDWVSTS